MYKLPLAFYIAILIFTQSTVYAADSTVAVVRDRYGGSLQYDTQLERERYRVERDRYRAPLYDRYNPPGAPPGYGYGAGRPPLPQYNYQAPIYPYGGYGGGYYPPNADIDPDQTQFNRLYEHNMRTMGQ